MRIPVTFIAVCAAATFAGGAASAQQSGQQSSSSSQQQQSSAGQNQPWQKAQAQEFFRSSDIVGKDTQTSNGQKLGSIKDVVFNQQGQIFALIDVGNSRLAVVPWQAVNASSAKGKQNVVLNTTQQQLQNGPVVSKDQWGALDNPEFTKGVYSYYKMQEPTAMGGASEPGGAAQGQGSSQQELPQGQQQQQPQSQSDQQK